MFYGEPDAKNVGNEEEDKRCCPVFRIVQPVSFGVQSGMAHLTFGGHVMPHSVLKGCKTNSFMKGAVLQLESGYLCTVIPAVGSLWDEKPGMEIHKHSKKPQQIRHHKNEAHIQNMYGIIF